MTKTAEQELTREEFIKLQIGALEARHQRLNDQIAALPMAMDHDEVQRYFVYSVMMGVEMTELQYWKEKT